MNFIKFKNSYPVKTMFRSMGLDQYLQASVSWRSLRELIVDFNACDEGNFVDAVRRRDGTASSGERILLHAICYACDFAWLADELTGGRAWQRMDSAGGDFRRAVAACISQEEQ